eukprot:5223254-Amphidinium_carterae.1
MWPPEHAWVGVSQAQKSFVSYDVALEKVRNRECSRDRNRLGSGEGGISQTEIRLCGRKEGHLDGSDRLPASNKVAHSQ